MTRPDMSSGDVLRNFVCQGIIDRILEPADERTITPGYLDWFSSLHEEVHFKQNSQFFDLVAASQSQRHQQHRFPTEQQPDIAEYWGIELARFVVPHGHIGFVQSIEQVLNDVNGDYYPSNISYWGSPRFVLTDVDDIRWYLRIQPFYGRHPARYNLSSAVPIPPHALPGSPYPDMAVIDGLWYPANNFRRLKLLVPSGRMLRFFMVTPPTTTYQWETSGRLTGYSQSAYQDVAVLNARTL